MKNLLSYCVNLSEKTAFAEKHVTTLDIDTRKPNCIILKNNIF